MAKMKAVQVPKAGADFELVEREIPEPGSGHVRIHVQACGICHSDVITKEGLFPGMSYPRVPGHEVAGVIDELGAAGSARSFLLLHGGGRLARNLCQVGTTGMAGRRIEAELAEASGVPQCGSYRNTSIDEFARFRISRKHGLIYLAGKASQARRALHLRK